MEIIVERMTDHERADFKDAHGGFLDVRSWVNVICTNDRVTKISFYGREFLEDHFPFEFIPPSTSTFRADECHLNGCLDPSLLPRCLTECNAERNQLHGTIDFSKFPKSLDCLKISDNAFEGSCILEDLPSTLTELSADGNQFSGEISLNKHPQGLSVLRLSRNKLNGSISIKNLPKSMRKLRLCRNNFSGEFRIFACPDALSDLSISYNNFSGTMVLGTLLDNIDFYWRNNHITAVVDAHGHTHPLEDVVLAEQVAIDYA